MHVPKTNIPRDGFVSKLDSPAHLTTQQLPRNNTTK